MFTGAYRGGGVSRFMCTYALTLSLFMFLSYGVLLYWQKFNLIFIQKECFCQKWLFFSNEINVCCNEIVMTEAFFYFKLLFRTKTVLVLIKYQVYLRYTVNFSVTSYFEKILCNIARRLFARLFYIDKYRHFFILLLLLLLLLL